MKNVVKTENIEVLSQLSFRKCSELQKIFQSLLQSKDKVLLS